MGYSSFASHDGDTPALREPTPVYIESTMSSELLADLRARDLIFQIAGEDLIDEWLSAEPRTLYCGFDPTADSLHSLMQSAQGNSIRPLFSVAR